MGPRRYIDYADSRSYYNYICTFGVILMGIALPSTYVVGNALATTSTSMMGVVNNHVINYTVPSSINIWWTRGFSLRMMLVIQWVSGYLVISMGITSSGVLVLLMDIIMACYGWIMSGSHAIGSSLFRLLLLVHMRRYLYYGSVTYNSSVVSVGVLIYVLGVVATFLGYSTVYGL